MMKRSAIIYALLIAGSVHADPAAEVFERGPCADQGVSIRVENLSGETVADVRPLGKEDTADE